MFSRNIASEQSNKTINSELNSQDFFDCIQQKRHEKIREYFADTNYKVWLLKDENGYTALHKSVFNGDFETTTLILEELKKRLGLGSTSTVSKFINERTNEGLTALHYAAYKGNLQILELLIKNGASLEAVTNLGKNVLHMAAEGNQPSMIIYLLTKCGQDILSVDENGSTPLHWACYSGGEESVNFLLSLNARINAQDKEKLTPLHLAVLCGRQNIVLRLLQRNANKNLTNSKGELPIDLARKKNYYNIIKLLENSDISPLCSLDTPIDYVEPNDIYKNFIFLMLCVPEIIMFILVQPFLEGTLNTLINLVSFALALLSFFILVRKEPGYRKNLELIKEAKNDYPLFIYVQNKQDVRNYCPTCYVQKSFNSRHCFICNKCVEDFSHHCFWINKCIGKNNKLFYKLFIITCIIYCLDSIFICIELLWDDVNLPYEKAFPPVWFNFGRDKGFRILGAAVVMIFSIICSFPLCFLFLIEMFKNCGLIKKKKIEGTFNDLDDIKIGKTSDNDDLPTVELQGRKEDALLPEHENEDENRGENVKQEEEKNLPSTEVANEENIPIVQQDENEMKENNEVNEINNNNE